MKQLLFSLLLVIPLLAQARPTKAEVFDAIEQIKEDITKVESKDAGKVLISFAQTSPDVKIAVGKMTAPWAKEEWGLSADREATLKYLILISYIAGNIESQLDRESALDNPYAGWLVVLESYKKLKRNAHFQSDSIERLSALDAAGGLERHAREVRRALY